MDFSFLLHNESGPVLAMMVGVIFVLFPDWLVKQDLAFQKRFFDIDLSDQHEPIATFTRVFGCGFILASFLGLL